VNSDLVLWLLLPAFTRNYFILPRLLRPEDGCSRFLRNLTTGLRRVMTQKATISIKGRLNYDKAYYHSGQNLLSTIFRDMILCVVLYALEIWFLTLREGHKLWVFLVDILFLFLLSLL
jgi:hypothetical protein